MGSSVVEGILISKHGVCQCTWRNFMRWRDGFVYVAEAGGRIIFFGAIN